MSRSSVPYAASLVALLLHLGGCSPELGRLVVHVVDPVTGEEVPGRVEVLGASGETFFAEDALPVAFECLLAPQPEWASPFYRAKSLFNPYAGTQQFYVDGRAHLELPPGEYQVSAERGNEFERAETQIVVVGGESVTVRLAPRRWIDPAAVGWYGADDHIHISRYSPDQNEWLARWMRAEGLHVANLLQMGTQDQFGVTPQYAFGDAGAYRSGDTLLLAGQEHPRSHLLGHTITLGAREPIDLRESYVLYEGFWRAAEEAGGVSGFAHWGVGPALDGLAISAPQGRIRFLEVLQFDHADYDVFYQLLNLGIRLTPTAGTDFPCLLSLPGRERFYTHVEGELDRAKWVEAIRRGRTFVSNGPILELDVEGHEMGDELLLDEPRDVSVRGAVHYNPRRDEITTLELIRNGEPFPARIERTGAGSLRLESRVPVEGRAWLAIRASGRKLGEVPMLPLELPDWGVELANHYIGGASLDGRQEYALRVGDRASAAHSAPIFVSVAGRALDAAAAADVSALAASWRERLDTLEARLAEERIGEIPIWDFIPYSDGVSEDHLRRHREPLIEAIRIARRYYATLEAEGGATEASPTP